MKGEAALSHAHTSSFSGTASRRSCFRRIICTAPHVNRITVPQTLMMCQRSAGKVLADAGIALRGICTERGGKRVSRAASLT